MTSSEGRDVCLKGWKVAGILDDTEKGLDKLQNLDPFHDVDLLEEVDGNESETERDMYISPFVDDNESQNTKMKMETFLMCSMKKLMMNKFKL